MGTKCNLDCKASNGQGHSADAINNDISQTVGRRELILTCSPTPSTMGTKCDLDLQG